MNSMADKLVKVLSLEQRVKIGEGLATDMADDFENYLMKGLVQIVKESTKTGTRAEYDAVLSGMRMKLVERLNGLVGKIEKFNG